MRTIATKLLVLHGLTAGTALGQGHAVFREDFDLHPAGSSVGALSAWDSSSGSGRYEDDATIRAGTPGEPVHSPPNCMRLVGFPCVPVHATYRVGAPGPITAIRLSFAYELQPNVTASVSVAGHPDGPFVDAGLSLAVTCSNSLSSTLLADLTHLIGMAGIGRELYVRWSAQSCNGTACTVFDVDSVQVELGYLADRRGKWQREASMAVPRSGFAVVAYAGSLYAFGGNDHTCPSEPARQIAEVERFDGQQWDVVDLMPNGGTSGLRAVALDGFIYVLGGFVPGGASSAAVWRYEPASKTWTSCASMPGERVSFGAIARDGRIHVIGGRSWPGWTYHGTVFVYDPSTDTWSEGQPHPGHIGAGDPLGDTTAVGAQGRVFIFGGMSGTGGFSDANDEIWLYDPYSSSPADAWVYAGRLPEALSGAFVETFGSRVVVLGGIERWSGSTYPANDEIFLYELRPPHIEHTATLRMPDFPSQCALLNGRLVLIGKNDGYGVPCASTDCWSIDLTALE